MQQMSDRHICRGISMPLPSTKILYWFMCCKLPLGLLRQAPFCNETHDKLISASDEDNALASTRRIGVALMTGLAAAVPWHYWQTPTFHWKDGQNSLEYQQMWRFSLENSTAHRCIAAAPHHA